MYGQHELQMHLPAEVLVEGGKLAASAQPWSAAGWAGRRSVCGQAWQLLHPALPLPETESALLPAC